MSYTEAKEKYAARGVDADSAIERLKTIPVALHCWQGDDVRGFDMAYKRVDSRWSRQSAKSAMKT